MRSLSLLTLKAQQSGNLSMTAFRLGGKMVFVTDPSGCWCLGSVKTVLVRTKSCHSPYCMTINFPILNDYLSPWCRVSLGPSGGSAWPFLLFRAHASMSSFRFLFYRTWILMIFLFFYSDLSVLPCFLSHVEPNKEDNAHAPSLTLRVNLKRCSSCEAQVCTSFLVTPISELLF